MKKLLQRIDLLFIIKEKPRKKDIAKSAISMLVLVDGMSEQDVSAVCLHMYLIPCNLTLVSGWSCFN